MSAWLWKNGALAELTPDPEAGLPGDLEDEYASRGYIRTGAVNSCFDVWVRNAKAGDVPGTLEPYRFIVWLEPGANQVDTIFIEDLPDWLTLQPLLAAQVQLYDAETRSAEQRD